MHALPSDIHVHVLAFTASGEIVYEFHHRGGGFDINTCSPQTQFDTFVRLFADRNLTVELFENNDNCGNSSRISGRLLYHDTSSCFQFVLFLNMFGRFWMSLDSTRVCATTTIKRLFGELSEILQSHGCVSQVRFLRGFFENSSLMFLFP